MKRDRVTTALVDSVSITKHVQFELYILMAQLNSIKKLTEQYLYVNNMEK